MYFVYSNGYHQATIFKNVIQSLTIAKNFICEVLELVFLCLTILFKKKLKELVSFE